ncbi:Uu.00g056720.m01.CDS01 [Anthostomella pinea]|uniref:Uu.00g056720.m01.CDS01 n=1 Tax=Anthostomella pinea TaxID=933095 RepID=A0AAI8VRJ9_9PEZI|nr:Uu.00g056720.m01.CDS01 [Anthostomella pinea]
MPLESEDVEVNQSHIGGAGRGLFARKDFAPGDLVLSIDRPLFAELETDRLLDTCAWCFQRGATDPIEKAQSAAMGLPSGFIEVKSCTGCRKVSYCSKTCQSKAWKREHKYECKVLGVNDRPDLPHHVRGVVKLLGRLNGDPGFTETVQDILKFRPAGEPGGLDKFSSLDKQRFDDFQMLGHAAFHYAGEPKIPNTEAKSASKALMFNIMSNTFQLSSSLDDINLGSGFDPVICSANHSCDPNTVLAFNQPKTLLRALKPIKKGEEIYLKYTEVTDPSKLRQADLKEKYLFTCQCSKCKEGQTLAEDTFVGIPEKLPSEYCELADKLARTHASRLERHSVPVDDSTTKRRLSAMQAEAFAVYENEQSSIEDVRKALQMCVTSGMWTWTRQPVPHLFRRLFSLYLDSAEPYRAFRVGIKMYFEITPELHPQPFYPDRLINTWALSTLTNVLCGPMHQEIYQEMAKSGLELRVIYFRFLFDVYDHMDQMYGFDSPFGRVVKNTYKQIMVGVGHSEADIREKVEKAWQNLEMVARGLDVSSL